MSQQSSSDAQRLAEERLKIVLELSTEWYWEQDESYRFTQLIGAGFGQTGLDSQQHVGTTRWDFDAVPVGDDGSWDRHKALLEARQPFADFVTRRVDDQGEMRYISSSGQPMFDRGRFTGYRGIAKDVTSSQRAEQLLRLEHMVARCVAEADNVSTALKSVIRSICETQGWECGRYLRVDEQAGVLRFSEFWNMPGDAIERFLESKRQAVLEFDIGLAGRAWQSGQPTWVANINEDPVRCGRHQPLIPA